jgi:RNA polymerase sigma-70 factor (ECF subfamily)
METKESHTGNDKPLEVRLPEKVTRDMQDVLSRYLPSFYRRAYRYLGNAADAEDAVQDALLSAWRNLDQSERVADYRPSPEDECVGSDLHG